MIDTAEAETVRGELVPRTCEEFAARIRVRHGAVVAEYVLIGQDFIDAKAMLPRGEFGRLKRELGVSDDTVERYMAIARNPAISKSAHERILPLRYTTLAVLAGAPAELLESAIAAGDISTEMTRADAQAWLERVAPKKDPTPPEPTVPWFDEVAAGRHIAAALKHQSGLVREVAALAKARSHAEGELEGAAKMVQVALWLFVQSRSPDRTEVEKHAALTHLGRLASGDESAAEANAAVRQLLDSGSYETAAARFEADQEARDRAVAGDAGDREAPAGTLPAVEALPDPQDLGVLDPVPVPPSPDHRVNQIPGPSVGSSSDAAPTDADDPDLSADPLSVSHGKLDPGACVSAAWLASWVARDDVEVDIAAWAREKLDGNPHDDVDVFDGLRSDVMALTELVRWYENTTDELIADAARESIDDVIVAELSSGADALVSFTQIRIERSAAQAWIADAAALLARERAGDTAGLEQLAATSTAAEMAAACQMLLDLAGALRVKAVLISPP